MKRFLAMILALTLVLSMVPATALQTHAEELTEEATAPVESIPETVPETVPTEPTETKEPVETGISETEPAETGIPETEPATEPVMETEPQEGVEEELPGDSQIMHPLELGTPVYLDMLPSERVPYVFTPDKTGYYMAYTTGAYAAIRILEQQDNGEWSETANPCHKDGYFLLTGDSTLCLVAMDAYESYVVQVDGYGFYLTVDETNITNVEVACPDKDIYEYTKGHWRDNFYEYEIFDMLCTTVTFDDGMKISDTGSLSLEFNGEEAFFPGAYSSMQDQSAESPWVAGNSYEIYFYMFGTHIAQVNILEAPENITISMEPIVIPEEEYGLQTSMNAAGEWVDYKHYWVQNYMKGTIFINDSEYAFVGDHFFCNETGYECTLWVKDDQSPENVWETGNHEVTVGVLGAEVTVPVVIADKWAMVQPMELNQAVTVEAADYDKSKFYSFTPDEDGYYVIYTTHQMTGEGYPGFMVHEGHENGDWGYLSWNNSRYDYGALHLMPMTAGKTYVFELEVYGGYPAYNLTVEKSNITKVEVCSEVELYEYTLGSWHEMHSADGTSSSYYHYSIDELLDYTVFYDDGTQKTGTADISPYDDFTYIWHGYEVGFQCDVYTFGQNFEMPWTAGNTYDSACEFIGTSYPVQVKLLEAPEDITIELEPIVIEREDFWYEYGYNADDMYTQVRHYDVRSHLRGTITINGKSFEIHHGQFFDEEDVEDEEDGTTYQLWLRDGQSMDHEWGVGIHEITVGIMGAEVHTTATIYDNWMYAQAMELETAFYVGGFEHERTKTFTFTPEEDGYYAFVIWNWNQHAPTTQFYEQWINGDWNWCGFDNGQYYGNNYPFHVRLMYMSAGKTYGMKCSYDSSDPDLHFNVNVRKTDIADLQVRSAIDLYEYTHGNWEGYEGYWEENGGYYRYSDLLDMISCTVTYKDGTQTTGTVEEIFIKVGGRDVAFDWDGWTGHQSSDDRWTAGNSYKIHVDFLGKQHTIKVNILNAPEDISIELDVVHASGEDRIGHSEGFGDGEDIMWWEYQWGKYIRGTITIDGVEYPIRNGRFYYPDAGYYCELYTRDDQKWNNVWEHDKIYEAAAGIMGVQTDCFVMIEDVPSVDPWILEILEKAPDLQDMPAIELDEGYSVVGQKENELRWFTFTPDETETYAFFTGGNMADTSGVVFDENFTYLDSHDDSPYSGHFTLVEELQAGETYVLAIRVYQDHTSYDVGVRKPVVLQELRLDPVEIPEDAYCWRYVPKDPEDTWNGRYIWEECLRGTAVFDDGTTLAIEGPYFSYDSISYQLECYDNQEGELWKAGGSYSVTVRSQGVTAETTVNITSRAIKDITFKPIILPAREYENEHYYWEDALSWTVTFTDGKKQSGTGNRIKQGDNYYLIFGFNNQGDYPFKTGNTYEVYALIGPHTVPVSVTIKQTDYSLPYVEDLYVKKATTDSVQIAFNKMPGAIRYEFYLGGGYLGSSTNTNYTYKGLTLGYYYELGVAAVYKVDGKEVSGPVNSLMCKPYIDIEKYSAVQEYQSVAYDGTEKRPEVTVKISSNKLLDPEKYTCEYSNNTEIGLGMVFVYGLDEYGGTILGTFEIVPQQVTGLKVVEETEDSATITFDPVNGATEYWVYNGTKLVEKITDTTYTFTGLKLGTTYNFSVRANAIVEDGLAFDSNFTGEASETVSVKPTDSVENFTVELKGVPAVYTGKALKPSVKVISDSRKTLGSKDYTVSYENNTEIGTATVTITGIGKYEGTITTTFDIVPPRANKPKVEAVSGSSAKLTFKGLKKGNWEPEWYDIYVDGVLHGRTTELEYLAEDLPAGKNIKFTVRAGVTIDGKDYAGEDSPPAPINLKHKMDVCKVVLDQAELVYTGKKLTPAVTVTGHKGAVLTEKVDYTVSYTNNTNTGIATVTVTGKGAYTGKATATFTIYPAQTTGLKVKSTTTTSVTITFTKSPSAQRYNIYLDGALHGSTTGNTYTFKNLVVSEIHDVYIIPEKTVKNVRFEGAPSDVLQIWAGTDIAKYNVTMEYSRADYAGEPLCPDVTVKVSSRKDALVLERDVDYIVEYVGNNVPGKASIVIKGIGKYAGTITKTFTIFMVKPAVTAFATGMNSIYVEFAPVPGATEYQVLVGGKVKATITDTSFEITGLKKNTNYKIAIKAWYIGDTYKQNIASDAVKIKTPTA